GETRWPFGKKTAAFEGKDGSPQPVEPDRNDRLPGATRDEFKALFELEQSPRAAQFTFRKNANDFPGFEFFSRCLNRVLGPSIGNGNGLDPAENGVQPFQVVNALENQKS